jgi:hypothetical protein
MLSDNNQPALGKNYKVAFWIRFFIANASPVFLVVGVLDLSKFHTCWYSGGVLTLLAGFISLACGLPFGVILLVAGLAPISIATGNLPFIMAVGLLAMLVGGVNLLELRKLKRDGHLTKGMKSRDKLLLFREHDIAHRIWRSLKRKTDTR